MPTLICDLRPSAAQLAHEYAALRHAGEPLLLFWPCAAPAPGMVSVATMAALDAAFEDEQIAVIAPAESARLPGWLALDDFHRILLLTDAPSPQSLPAPEAALLQALFAAGAESAELLTPAAAADLAQSWHSGRRTGACILTKSSTSA